MEGEKITGILNEEKIELKERGDWMVREVNREGKI